MEVIATNNKAEYNFEIKDKFNAGLVLKGTEVKSIREGRVSINEAYGVVQNGEAYIKDVYIKPAEHSPHYNHEPRRKRKLLLHKHQIRKLRRKTKKKGYTIIPVELFINDKGWIKLTIALAKGRKKYSKKRYLKERDQKKKKEREISEYLKRKE